MIIGYVLIGILVALVVYLIVYQRKISKTNKKYADTNSGGDSVKEPFTKDALGDIFKTVFVIASFFCLIAGIILIVVTAMDGESTVPGWLTICGAVALLFSSRLISTLSSINVTLKEINQHLKDKDQ